MAEKLASLPLQYDGCLERRRCSLILTVKPDIYCYRKLVQHVQQQLNVLKKITHRQNVAGRQGAVHSCFSLPVIKALRRVFSLMAKSG